MCRFPLESVGHHACSGTDRPFFHRPAGRAIQRRHHMLLRHMTALDIVQPSIVTFGDDGCERIVFYSDRRILLDHPTYDAVGDARDIERIREGDRVFKKSGLRHPGEAGHFASTV